MITIRWGLDWIIANERVTRLVVMAVAMVPWHSVVMAMFAMTIVMMTMICQMNVQPTGMLGSLGMRIVRMGRGHPAKQEMCAHEQ